MGFLSNCPNEVLEVILAKLTIIDINNLLVVSNDSLAIRLASCIYEANGQNNRCGYGHRIALAPEDSALFETGQFKSIRDALSFELSEMKDRNGFKGLRSLIISGSTCLLASDLAFLSMPIGTKDDDFRQLRSIEIFHSKTFSPFTLLHHAAESGKSYGPIVFNLTGEHPMLTNVGNTFRQNTNLFILTFLYIYGADICRNIPRILSSNLLGFQNQLLVIGIERVSYILNDKRAVKDEPRSADSMGTWQFGTGLDEYFLQYVAMDRWTDGNLMDKEHSQEKFPCGHCNYLLPRYCYSKAAMMRIRAGEGCKCMMCMYELFEHEEMLDMVWMRKYKTNVPLAQARAPTRCGGWASRHEEQVNRPPFYPDTLGIRSVRQPVVPLRDPATISDNDFCRFCGEKMAPHDIKAGLCQPCQVDQARREIQTPENFEKLIASFKDMDPRIYPEFPPKNIEWDSVSMDGNDSEIAFEDYELDEN